MYDVPDQEDSEFEELVAMTATRQRSIGLLHGERTFLAWDIVPRGTGPLRL